MHSVSLAYFWLLLHELAYALVMLLPLKLSFIALETNGSERNYSVAGLTSSWSHHGRNHIFYLIKIRLLLLCRFH